jgi:hypothetical protein
VRVDGDGLVQRQARTAAGLGAGGLHAGAMSSRTAGAGQDSSLIATPSSLLRYGPQGPTPPPRTPGRARPPPPSGWATAGRPGG